MFTFHIKLLNYTVVLQRRLTVILLLIRSNSGYCSYVRILMISFHLSNIYIIQSGQISLLGYRKHIFSVCFVFCNPPFHVATVLVYFTNVGVT